jgi:hypothetical protein
LVLAGEGFKPLDLDLDSDLDLEGLGEIRQINKLALDLLEL